MRLSTRSASGFTLIEIVVATGVIALVGGVVFTLLNLGMTLYAQNVAINRTHAGGLVSTERLLVDVAAASEAPVLVNDAGATVTGNGPAAGILYFSPASSSAYPVPSAVSAAAMSFAITKTASQPAPQIGDRMTMPDLGFQGVVTSVSGSGGSYTIGFASTVGSGFTPAKTSGTAIPAASKGFLQAPSAVISVGSVLRRYPRAKSVAQDGAAAFNAQANFDAVATLLPVASQTNCFPFQYLDPARRAVDVNLRVRAAVNGSAITAFYTFQNVKTTVAYRSASSL